MSCHIALLPIHILTSKTEIIVTYIYIYTHTGCPGRNVPDFGRMFLKLKYIDITQNIYNGY